MLVVFLINNLVLGMIVTTMKEVLNFEHFPNTDIVPHYFEFDQIVAVIRHILSR